VQRRLEGYRAAMKAASLFDPRTIVTTPVPTTVTLGGTLFADLLSRRPDIEAVACVNDDLALGVLFECQRRHIAVPDDIAIVGFNDLEFMAAAVPSLTSVRTNRYEMGRRAVSMVTAAIDGNRPPEPVIDLGFELMIRQSSSTRGI
jgi:LacI family gluconate utilization system Gnt-I transcriptional repressor